MKIFHPEIEEKYENLKDRKEGDPYFLVTK